MKTRKLTTREVVIPALFIAATVYAAFNLGGCATLGQADLEQRIIAAATKCVGDAASVLTDQAERVATQAAIKDLVEVRSQVIAARLCPAPDAAQAMPLQSRKP